MNLDWADKRAEDAMDYSCDILPDLDITPEEEESNTPQQQKFLDSISDQGPFNVTMTGTSKSLTSAVVTSSLKKWNVIACKVESIPDGFMLKFSTYIDCCRIKNVLDKKIQGTLPTYKFLSDSTGYLRNQQRKNINYGGDRFSRTKPNSKTFNQGGRDRDRDRDRDHRPQNRDNRQPQDRNHRQPQRQREEELFNVPVGGSIRKKPMKGETQIIRQPLLKRNFITNQERIGTRSNESSPINRQRRTTAKPNTNLRRPVDRRENRDERRGGDRWGGSRGRGGRDRDSGGRDRDSRYNENSNWDNKPERRGFASDNWRPKNSMSRSSSSRTSARPNREFKRQPQILQKSKYSNEEAEKPKRGNRFAALTQD